MTRTRRVTRLPMPEMRKASYAFAFELQPPLLPARREMLYHCPSTVESTLARWHDMPWVRSDNGKITAGTVAAVVMTAMLFVIMFALLIAV